MGNRFFTVALGVIALGALAPQAQADIFTVTGTTGVVDDEVCSLEEAVREANGNTPNNDCQKTVQAGVDVVRISTAVTSDIAVTELLNVTDDLVIEWQGTGRKVVSGSGLTTSRLIELAATKSLTLRRLDLRNGSGTNSGGAVRTNTTSALIVEDCAFRNNTANGPAAGWAQGGALWIQGTLTVTDSEFVSNKAQASEIVSSGQGVTAYGGAVYCAVGPCNFDRVLFQGNEAIGGDTLAGGTGGQAMGGALNLNGNGRVTNCTFTANAVRGGDSITHAGGDAKGAAINENQPSIVEFSTFKANVTDPGAGTGPGNPLHAIFGPVTMRANLVAADNDPVAGDQPFCGSTVISQGANLFAVDGDRTSCRNTGSSGTDNVAAFTLSALTPVGKTSAFFPNAAGAETVPAAVCTTFFGAAAKVDQAGRTRPQGTDCDAGSIETPISNVGVVLNSTPSSVYVPASGDDVAHVVDATISVVGGAATDVLVELVYAADALCTEAAFISGPLVGTPSCTFDASSALCDLGNLNAATSVVMRFTCEIGVGTQTTQTYEATVLANELDLVPANNDATRNVPVLYCGDNTKNGSESCDDGGAAGGCNATCDDCAAGFAGTSCVPCPLSEGLVCGGVTRGTCVGDGDAGNADPAVGTCDCNSGFTGAACGSCATGFAGAQCDSCAAGYFGPECTPCPGGAATPCSGNGTCLGSGDIGSSIPLGGQCDCDPGASGIDCSASCGDGVVAGDEQCDTSGESATCDVDCSSVGAGDGVVNVAAGEECDDGNGASGDGCAATKVEAGFTCAGPGACTLACGTFFDFATSAGEWRAVTTGAAAGGFSYGVPGGIFGSAKGWETALGGNVPLNATFSAQLRRRVAFAPLSSARATRVDVKLQGDNAGDCLRVYVSETVPPTAGTHLFQDCGSFGTSTAVRTVLVPSNLLHATNPVTRWLTIEYAGAASATPRRGVLIEDVEVVSDWDADGVRDFKTLSCGDSCVDKDLDGHGDPTTRTAETCAAAIDDCNDDNQAVNKAQQETCNDLVDNDCNGIANPGEDPFCVEDCGNFVDDSPGNALVDCRDAVCDLTLLVENIQDKDPMCSTPCRKTWAFNRGSPSFAVPNGDAAIFAHDANNGWWKTSGLSTSSASRQIGRIRLRVPFGTRFDAGPKPVLQVLYSMTAHTGAGTSDRFSLCVDDTANAVANCGDATVECQASNPSFPCRMTISTATASNQTANLDLARFLGQAELFLTLEYDTRTTTGTRSASSGVTITELRLGSDADNDGLFEGTDRYTTDDAGTPLREDRTVCDPCWDLDLDFYGDADSPNARLCQGNVGRPQNLPALVDCDDTRNTVRPDLGSETSCSDGLNNDCDFAQDGTALTDALDADCGTEDCANGEDDNGDTNVDCADPTCTTNEACNACFTGYTFDVGGEGAASGWVPSGRIGTGQNSEAKCAGEIDPARPECPWEVGASTVHSAQGWATALDADLDSLVPPQGGRVRGWLTRTVEVAAGMPEPAIDLAVRFEGDGSQHVWGVCVDVATATACSLAQPANIAFQSKSTTVSNGATTAWVADSAYPTVKKRNDGYFDRVVVPVSGAGSHTVVIFFDSQAADTDAENAFDGLFVDRVRVRSDIDLDGLAENTPSQCDKCIDVDKDGFGQNLAFANLQTCTQTGAADCDDTDPNTRPNLGNELTANACYKPGDVPLDKDNNCDGKRDSEVAECAVCGNGSIDLGESCDDGPGQIPPVSGDGCSATCRIEVGGLYLSEIHLPILFASPAEQWIEIHNATNATFELDQVGLAIAIGHCPFDPATKVPLDPDVLVANPGNANDCMVLDFVDRQGDPAECYFNSESLAPNGYYVLNFGDPATSGFESEIDASCNTPISLAQAGDIVTVLLKSGNQYIVADQVDFRVPAQTSSSNDPWECALANQRTNVGRSIMLGQAESSNASDNDNFARWCLAGPTNANRYGTTDRHFGSPGAPGMCGEFACDGVDDDCNGSIDQVTSTVTVNNGVVSVTPAEDVLFDIDDDGVCSQFDEAGNIVGRDCDAFVASCTTGPLCVADADSDGVIDCKDGCLDADGDFFGTTNPVVQPACISSGRCTIACEGSSDCNDTTDLVNPGQVEGELAAQCVDGLDQDCDSIKDCLDPGCESQATCAGETCDASALALTCGQSVTVSPVSADFPRCAVNAAGGERDKVYRFTAATTGSVRFIVQNLGTKRYELQVYENSCTEVNCNAALAVGESQCVAGGSLNVPVTAGRTYFVVAKQVGACQNGAGTSAKLTVGCGELCDGQAIDEDADGLTDCADADCVGAGATAPATLCRTADFDGDGVSNQSEYICGTDRLVAGQSISDDRFRDTDEDGQLNCVDADDDNDGALDTQEVAACLTPLSKNRNNQYPQSSDPACSGRPACLGAAPLQCNIPGADADCNKQIDSAEAECGTKEALCGNVIDDDADSRIDCADDDCIPDVLCRDTDWDGDGVSNHLELQCATNPREITSFPAASEILDPENDTLPNCVDPDDDGDLFSDVEETLCGSDGRDPNSKPVDTDRDGQCDAVDLDDDNDSFPDAQETQCGSDPLVVASKPTDAAVDRDQDRTCDTLDADDDGDTWLDFEESQCETDPLDKDSNPTALFQDVDADRICDKLDTNDDNDAWTDSAEQSCGTDPRDGNDVPADCDGDLICDVLDTDDDGDNVPDSVEALCGTGICDKASKPLEIETQDSNGNGIANCVDPDDDGDGIPDLVEYPAASCPAPIPLPAGAPNCTDIRNKDTDEDGLEDGEEDADKNGRTNGDETSPIRVDSDADALDDDVEAESCYPTGVGDACGPTKGAVRDTDGDGLADGVEDADHDGVLGEGESNPLIGDTDGDSFGDGEEVGCGASPVDANSVPVDVDEDGTCDGRQPDRDRDGVADGVEVLCQTDPLDATSVPSLPDRIDEDGDGDINCVDLDDDEDTVSDANERECGTNPRNDQSKPTEDDIADYDNDGALNCSDADDDDDTVSDTQEATLGTDRLDRDSDDDGLSDGQEVTLGTSPLDPDTDADGLQDGTEFGLSEGTVDTAETFQPDLGPAKVTDPKNPDTDGDGVKDGDEDANHDGKLDEGEGDPLDPSDGLRDTDGDGLIDREEVITYDTDPKKPDTDDDGLNDKLETQVHFTDPRDADTDDGGIVDGTEVDLGTDPKDAKDDFTAATIRGDNVFGCQGGKDGGGLMLLFSVLGSILFIGRKRLARLLPVALVAGAAAPAMVSDARAQEATPDVNIEQFIPAGGRHRVWSIEASQVAPAWKPFVGLTFFGERDSLILTAGQHQERLVGNQQTAELMLGIGLADIMQFELAVPFVVGYESGEGVTSVAGADGGMLSGGGMADLRVRLRSSFIDNRTGGFGLGLSVGATFPTGDGEKFRSDPGVGILANLIADYRAGGTVLAFNIGTRIRTTESEFLTAKFGNELLFGLGLDVEVAPNVVWLGTELFGKTALDAPFDQIEASSLEVLFGPKWQFIPDFSFQAAAGAGLVQGRGTPDFRFVFGLQWAPGSDDDDMDGVLNADDRCPSTLEDRDGFADHDGCPEPDNDNDGLLDLDDKCPLQRETFNGIDDEDGCPEEDDFSDKDLDGIPDDRDQCPLVPETVNGKEDGDGCPDINDAPVLPGGPDDSRLPQECRVSLKDLVVYFAQDGAELSEEAKATLVKVADVLNNNSDVIEFVSINGHSSEEGDDVKNLRLSQQRAQRVKTWLQEQVVDRDRMAARGFGEHSPRVDKTSAEASRENRSVDFTLQLVSKCRL